MRRSNISELKRILDRGFHHERSPNSAETLGAQESETATQQEGEGNGEGRQRSAVSEQQYEEGQPRAHSEDESEDAPEVVRRLREPSGASR